MPRGEDRSTFLSLEHLAAHPRTAVPPPTAAGAAPPWPPPDPAPPASAATAAPRASAPARSLQPASPEPWPPPAAPASPAVAARRPCSQIPAPRPHSTPVTPRNVPRFAAFSPHTVSVRRDRQLHPPILWARGRIARSSERSASQDQHSRHCCKGPKCDGRSPVALNRFLAVADYKRTPAVRRKSSGSRAL